MSGILVENGKTENVRGEKQTNTFVHFDTTIFIYSVLPARWELKGGASLLIFKAT